MKKLFVVGTLAMVAIVVVQSCHATKNVGLGGSCSNVNQCNTYGNSSGPKQVFCEKKSDKTNKRCCRGLFGACTSSKQCCGKWSCNSLSRTCGFA